MKDRDETGLAFAPLVGAAISSLAFGPAWPLAFLAGSMAAYLIALAVAWPLVFLLRKFGLVSFWHFATLGFVLALPFVPLPFATGFSPRFLPPWLSISLVACGGVATGALFWRVAQRHRNAL